MTVGSEVKPGGYTKKTRIVVLFIYRKKKEKIGTFQLSLNHSWFVSSPESVARPKLPFQLPFSHIVVFWKPSIKDDFPILQLDIWPSNMQSNTHIYHSLDREQWAFCNWAVLHSLWFIRAPHRGSGRQTSRIWNCRAVLTTASSMSKPNLWAAQAMGFM